MKIVLKPQIKWRYHTVWKKILNGPHPQKTENCSTSLSVGSLICQSIAMMGTGFTRQLMVVAQRPMSVTRKMDFPGLSRQEILCKQFFWVCSHLQSLVPLLKFNLRAKQRTRGEKQRIATRSCRRSTRQLPLIATDYFNVCFFFPLSQINGDGEWRLSTC